MEYPDIDLLVPHAGTMILIDRVISADAESLCAEVMIRPNSLFYEVVDQNTEGVGAWVGIEYMAQAIAAYAGYHAMINGEKPKIGFLVSTRNYDSSKAYFEKNSILQIYIKSILQAGNGLNAFECKIKDADSDIEIASAVINAFLPENLEEFFKETVYENSR